MKKVFVTVIAIALVAAVIGSCFALYEQSGTTSKSVALTATAEVCQLTIDTSTSLAFAGISPTNSTHSVDVTLDTSDSTLVDGVHGIFKVAVSGDIASYVDVAVNSIASVGAVELGAANADALTVGGADITLSAVPQYYRVTVSLKAAYSGTEFEAVAELTGTITVSFVVDESTVFAYDAEAFYVVGKINGGTTKWYPTANSVVLSDPVGSGNLAQKASVTLKAGDKIKVVKNYKAGAVWYSGQAINSSVTGVSGIDEDGNVLIDADGTYDIYVNDSSQIWVAAHE